MIKISEIHIKRLKEVFSRLRIADLTLNKDICNYVTQTGLYVEPDKINDIVELPTHKTSKKLKGFLICALWYRKFILNFAEITSPIVK